MLGRTRCQHPDGCGGKPITKGRARTEPIEDEDSEPTEDLEVTEEEAEDVKGGMPIRDHLV